MKVLQALDGCAKIYASHVDPFQLLQAVLRARTPFNKAIFYAWWIPLGYLRLLNGRSFGDHQI